MGVGGVGVGVWGCGVWGVGEGGLQIPSQHNMALSGQVSYPINRSFNQYQFTHCVHWKMPNSIWSTMDQVMASSLVSPNHHLKLHSQWSMSPLPLSNQYRQTAYNMVYYNLIFIFHITILHTVLKWQVHDVVQTINSLKGLHTSPLWMSYGV